MFLFLQFSIGFVKNFDWQIYPLNKDFNIFRKCLSLSLCVCDTNFAGAQLKNYCVYRSKFRMKLRGNMNQCFLYLSIMPQMDVFFPMCEMPISWVLVHRNFIFRVLNYREWLPFNIDGGHSKESAAHQYNLFDLWHA